MHHFVTKLVGQNGSNKTISPYKYKKKKKIKMLQIVGKRYKLFMAFVLQRMSVKENIKRFDNHSSYAH